MNHVDQDHRLSMIANGELIAMGGTGSANVAMWLPLVCNGINFSKKTPLRIRVVPGATQRREATHNRLIVAIEYDQRQQEEARC